MWINVRTIKSDLHQYGGSVFEVLFLKACYRHLYDITNHNIAKHKLPAIIKQLKFNVLPLPVTSISSKNNPTHMYVRVYERM